MVKKYEFFVKLFKIVRDTDSKTMVNDPAEIKAIFSSNSAQLCQSNDRNSYLTMITEFFAPSEFLKRLELHRLFVCKSKTKKQTDLKLYYKQIPQRERLLNLINFVPANKVKQQKEPDEAAL